jgi:hypothetical protein
MFKNLFVPTVFVFFSVLGVSAAEAENPPCYTIASLQGSWALIATYGANVAMSFGQRYIDENGNLTGVFVLNGPTAGSTTGERTITTGTQTGTVTVNCDGTGTFNRTLTASNGVVTAQVDDFIITGATVKHGQFTATAIADAVRTPSALVPGGIFVTRVHTRLPDRPGPTQP